MIFCVVSVSFAILSLMSAWSSSPFNDCADGANYMARLALVFAVLAAVWR